MQTRREYAASLGLAIAGARGKFSTAAKDAIAKAEAGGMRFSDTVTTSAPTKTVKSEKSPVLGKTDARMAEYLFPDEYRFPEAEYRATVLDNGKRREVSLRECCNTCKVSLVNHACDAPTIHSGTPVKIERR